MIKINKYIDSTLLNPEATKQEIIDFVNEAIEYDFAAVCVHNSRVQLARNIIKDKNIEISGTVGFPFGNNPVSIKIFEATQAIALGASEIDFVINIGYVKDHEWDKVLEELILMRKAIPNNTLKVIFETCLLTKQEIIKCCEFAVQAKIDFVKTSTGYNKEGATIENIKLMKSIVENNVKVKAVGGVKTYNEALKFIELGVSRIGTSSGKKLVLNEKIISNY